MGCLFEGWGGGHLFDIVAKGMGTYTRKYSIPVSEVVVKQFMKDFALHLRWDANPCQTTLKSVSLSPSCHAYIKLVCAHPFYELSLEILMICWSFQRDFCPHFL